jgi:hypothetical protein
VLDGLSIFFLEFLLYFCAPFICEHSLGACQRDVQTAGVVEEADALVLVGAHARKNDVVFLAALRTREGKREKGKKNEKRGMFPPTILTAAPDKGSASLFPLIYFYNC